MSDETSGSIGRIRAMLRKEFRQFFKDRFLLVLVLWLYTAEVVICAAALTFDLDEEPIALLDLDRSRESRLFAEKIDLSPSFRIRFRLDRRPEAEALLDGGSARMVVVIPQGYGEQLLRHHQPDVQVLLDGSHPVIASTARGEVQRLIARSALERSTSLSGITGSPRVDNRVRVWYNPTLRFSFSVVISMIAAAAFSVGVIYTAASIVKEKERGTIDQLLVSPLRSYELVAAKTLTTLTIGLASLIPSLVIARAFELPFRGSPVDLAIVSAAFLLSAIAMGVLIASLVRTLQQALLVAFFLLFPLTFLSGTTTPIESMPRPVQLLADLNPVRYYEETLYGVILKGVGLDLLWPQIVWMLGLGAVLFASALLVFRRRLS